MANKLLHGTLRSLADAVVERSIKDLADDDHLCTMLCALQIVRPSEIMQADQWDDFKAEIRAAEERRKAFIRMGHGL